MFLKLQKGITEATSLILKSAEKQFNIFSAFVKMLPEM